MATHGGAAEGAFKVNSLVLTADVSPVSGVIVWDTARSLWNSFIFLSALSLAPLYFSWSAFVLFLALSAITLCTGHSVGFHRRLIHRSFKCSKTLERILRVDGHGGRHRWPSLDDSHARHSRLVAAATALP